MNGSKVVIIGGSTAGIEHLALTASPVVYQIVNAAEKAVVERMKERGVLNIGNRAKVVACK